MPNYFAGTFRADITPPLGHPLCGGWIESVRGHDDPLEAVGVVLLGPDPPIVICALDWCGLRNEAFELWRKALADAAHTSIERVHIHTVHQHNAPLADVEAEALLRMVMAKPSMDLKFFEECVNKTAAALKECLKGLHRIDRVGMGSAVVNQVASNRRILGPDGKVKHTRTSATKSKEVRDEPEGLIDPNLKTISFFQGERPIVAMHYYATHPMSYYGDGMVSSDFCGLARKKRQADAPSVFQMYFTGCAGNITAGKYNDGSRENRAVLSDRIYQAMAAAWKTTYTAPLKRLELRTDPIVFGIRKESAFGRDENEKMIADGKAPVAKRNMAALNLSWLKREKVPIHLSCLDLGVASIVHLPGEPFVEYQLAAQQNRPDQFVCVAGYGDDGIGYIPTDKAFFEGGYEPTVALAPPSENKINESIKKLMGAKVPEQIIPFKRFKKKPK